MEETERVESHETKLKNSQGRKSPDAARSDQLETTKNNSENKNAVSLQQKVNSSYEEPTRNAKLAEYFNSLYVKKKKEEILPNKVKKVDSLIAKLQARVLQMNAQEEEDNYYFGVLDMNNQFLAK